MMKIFVFNFLNCGVIFESHFDIMWFYQYSLNTIFNGFCCQACAVSRNPVLIKVYSWSEILLIWPLSANISSNLLVLLHHPTKIDALDYKQYKGINFEFFRRENSCLPDFLIRLFINWREKGICREMLENLGQIDSFTKRVS